MSQILSLSKGSVMTASVAILNGRTPVRLGALAHGLRDGAEGPEFIEGRIPPARKRPVMGKLLVSPPP